MPKLHYTILTAILGLFCFANHAYGQSTLKLWYNKPATAWTEALPIGNGRIAAMVFGAPEQEQLQLNEETVWAGGPHNNVNPDAKAVIPQLRKLIFEKKYVEAQALANDKMFSKQNGMSYQTVGNLLIDFPGHDMVTDYYRDLNIGKAIATVKYKVNGINYKRELIASFSRQVILIRLTADKPGSITFNLHFNSPQLKQNTHTTADELMLSGISGDQEGIAGQVKFEAAVKVLNEGGVIRHTDTSLNISHANSATLYLAMGTNFKSFNNLTGDEQKITADYLNKAVEYPFSELLTANINDYKKYFDRVKFNLSTDTVIEKPTDDRIKDFAQANDLGLISLYYQFGRYLLICSSQPGNQAANLQGKWNDKLMAPWDSKYTININTEMNYWPAEETNLTELTEPLIHLIKDLSVSGHESASKMYGSRGWMAHHNTDIWRITGQVDNAFYGLFPTGGAWLTQHLWTHYLYTGDKKYLKDIYPVIKGAATFFVDALQEEPDHHWLVVSPSMSPEHSFMQDAKVGEISINAGTTMDNQIVFDLFSNTIAAAEVLGIDKAFIDTLKAKRSRLPPMQIGKWGQLQEWMYDWDIKGDTHRHISQLFGLYPGRQISPYRTPQLFEAAKNLLLSRGDASTGWSMAWKVNFWARLLDGNHAYKLIKTQLHITTAQGYEGNGGTYPNLFDACPPFQIDGNFGFTAGITEMLLQSYDGEINILPALPDDWPTGSVKGLKAPGGFTVDMAWDHGKVKNLIIYSALGGNCRIRIKQILSRKIDMKNAIGENKNPYYRITTSKSIIISQKAPLKGITIKNTHLYDLSTYAGGKYVVM